MSSARLCAWVEGCGLGLTGPDKVDSVHLWASGVARHHSEREGDDGGPGTGT